MKQLDGKLRANKLPKEPGKYLDGHGLYLQVTSPAARSWVFRWERNDRERLMGLGPLHTVSLEEAREAALDARRLLHKGIDPLEAKRAEKAAKALEMAKALTFEAAARQYYAQHSPKWGVRHREQFMSSLEAYAFPTIGKLSVAAIDTGLVLKVVEPSWATKTETMNRVLGRIAAVLDFAKVRGAREGENPARWKGHLDNLLPARSEIAKVKHHPALAYTAMPDFMAKLAALPGIPAMAFRFLILTAGRTGEVVGCRWSEIDLAARLWTVPAARMKAGKEHRVPLNDAAMQILEALPRENDYVFPGSRKDAPINSMAMRLLLGPMGHEGITVHGFRSTFSDWAAERATGFSHHVVEMALAHSVGTAVSQAYRRSDLVEQRAKLAEAWARYCTTPAADATVTPIRKLGA
jgi:integrase